MMNNDNLLKSINTEEEKAVLKQSYTSPSLTVYGDVQKVTQDIDLGLSVGIGLGL